MKMVSILPTLCLQVWVHSIAVVRKGLRANQLSDQREKNNDELDELKDALVGESKSQVIVKDVVYAGTKICINDVQMTLKSDNQYCKFFKDRGDIRSTSL